jgi:hypothetical protein
MFGIKKRMKRIEENPTGLWFSWWAFLLGLLGAWILTTNYGFRLDWRSWFKMIWILGVFLLVFPCRRALEKIKNRTPSDDVFASVLITYTSRLYVWFGVGSFLWLYVLVFIWG